MKYLSAYLDETLAGEAVAECGRHLDSCEACQAYVNTYLRTPDVIERSSRIAVPPEIQARLRAFLRSSVFRPESEDGVQ